MNIIIRKATPADARSIQTVQDETGKKTYANEALGIQEEDLVVQDSEERVKRREKHLKTIETEPGWVAAVEGEIVGFSFAQKNEKYNRITSVYVLPAHQSKGLGKQLLLSGLIWLGDELPIRVRVASYNKQAIGFYKAFGFIEQGKGEDSHTPTGKAIPTIELVKPANSKTEKGRM